MESKLSPPSQQLIDKLKDGHPDRRGVYRVFDPNKKPLGLAYWNGKTWGPCTFDPEAVIHDPAKAKKATSVRLWSGYRPTRERHIPFEIVRVRGDVLRVLTTGAEIATQGMILEPHPGAETGGKQIYCYVPRAVGQQSEVLAADGAFEVVGQLMAEPPKQWRGEVKNLYMWIEAIHLEPVKRHSEAPTATSFKLVGGRLKLVGEGQSLLLSERASSALKNLLSA